MDPAGQESARFPSTRPRARRRVVTLLGALVALGLLGLLAYGLVGRLGLAAGPGGKAAPDFQLALYGSGGQTWRLADQRGKGVVVNFWASWCVPCRAEMPALQKLYSESHARGVEFIGVGVQDTEADALAFLSEMGVTFPTGLDADGSILQSYSVLGLPSTYFVNKRGQIVREWVGLITEERLRLYVQEIAG